MVSLAIVVHDVQYAVGLYQNKHCASAQLRIDLKAVDFWGHTHQTHLERHACFVCHYGTVEHLPTLTHWPTQ